MESCDEQTAVKRRYGQNTYPKQDYRRPEQQQKQHHFRDIGGGVGFVVSAREKTKRARWLRFTILLCNGGATTGFHPFDATTTKIEVYWASLESKAHYGFKGNRPALEL